MSVTRQALLSIPGCTPDRLKRWAKHGLLPRGTQKHGPGRGGSISLYPDGTDALLRELIARHQSERRLDELAIWLWWDDQPIPMSTIRRLLAQFVRNALAELDLEKHRASGDAITLAERMTVQAMRTELCGSTAKVESGEIARRKDVRALRRQAGSTQDFLSAAAVIMQLALGEAPVWESTPEAGDDDETSEQSPARAFAAMMGDESQAHLLPDTFAAMLKDGVLPLTDLPMKLDDENGLTDVELERARDVARSMIDSG